ncbi:TRAP transporter small permease [Rhodococcus opacus]|uniref:TRAP transporter small permease n=1 Tax=Rhodococcus opacus TaxID=37919 RepID=UPI001C48AAC9|nr:TRAP transporter small permease subunit [Rhodococcus opacus]MBV6759096.1 TRAP transporter small permease [Rhodococcus opacus]
MDTSAEEDDDASTSLLQGVVVDPDSVVGGFAADHVEPVAAAESDVPFAVSKVDRALKVMDWVLEVFALGALTVLMLVTVANAFMRYVFESPIQGSMNISLLYLMPAVVFLALPRVQAVGAHISATLVVDRLGAHGRLLCKFLVTVIVVLIIAVMLQGALHELGGAWEAVLGGQPSLPLGPSWLFVVIGLAGAVVRGVWQIVTIRIERADGAEQERNSDVV